MKGISHFGFVAPYRSNNDEPPTALERCQGALAPAEAAHYENKASWNHRISVIKAVAFVAIAIAAFALCGVFGVGGIIISLVAGGCLLGAGLLYKFSIENNLQEKREAKEIAQTLREFQYFCENGELPQEKAVEKEEGPKNEGLEPSQTTPAEEKEESAEDEISAPPRSLEETIEEEGTDLNEAPAPAPSRKLTFNLETYQKICTDLGITQNPFSNELIIDDQSIEFAERLAPLLIQYEYFQAKKRQHKELCAEYQEAHKKHLEEEQELRKTYPLALSIDECGGKKAAELKEQMRVNRINQFNAQETYRTFKTQAAFAYALAHCPDFRGDFGSVAGVSQVPAYTLLLPDPTTQEVVSFRPFDPENPLQPITRSDLIIKGEKQKVRELGDRFIEAFEARKKYDEAQAAAQAGPADASGTEASQEGGSGNDS